MAALAPSNSIAWLAQRFELSRGGAGANLLAMEGLRGFAVFLVFLVHYTTLVGPWVTSHSGAATLLDAMHSVGNVGVDLFFVLSGYLIYGHLIGSPQRFAPYFARRVRRIYPAFLVVFLIYLLLSWARPMDSKLPGDAVAATVFIAQNLLLLPGLLPISPLITVAWSLSYEMFFYLVVPVTIAVLSLRERTAGGRMLGFSVAAGSLIGISAWVGGPVRLAMFLAGMLLHEILPRRAAPGSILAGVVTLGGLGAMTIPMPGPAGQALRTTVLFASFFVLCMACFGRPQRMIGRAFCWTPMRWLGNMSYSYYLIHGLTLKALFLALSIIWPPRDAPGFAIMFIAPAFALTLLPATMLFMGVERPLSLRTGRRAIRSPSAA